MQYTRCWNCAARTVLPGIILLLLACGPPAEHRDRTPIDPAIRLYLEGRPRDAIEAFRQILEKPVSDEVRRETYYFIGRCHEDLGEIRESVEAFRMAVQYGDNAASLEYLRRLLPLLDGTSAGFARRVSVTRVQLAMFVFRRVRGGSSDNLPDDPTDRIVREGWLTRLPDGELHADATVTRAAFAVYLARLCRRVRCRHTPRVAADDRPVTGREVVRALDRLLGPEKSNG